MARRSRDPAQISVPLRAVALQGTVPSRWKGDFLLSQGKRAKLAFDTRDSYSDALSELRAYLPPAEGASEGKAKYRFKRKPKIGAVVADVVSLGDRWIKGAVQGGLVVPIPDAREAEWYKDLSPELKEVVTRNSDGDVDLEHGQAYAAPYRMGCLMVAWRADKFLSAGIPPIQRWEDLVQPSLKGRVALLSGTRETLALAQRLAGAPFNVESLSGPQAPLGPSSLEAALKRLRPQVRIQDNASYLKGLQLGDAWAAVGWSSDVLPFQKRNNFIASCIPRDGTVLFADVWVIPATVKLDLERIGGRIHGPSPLTQQWLDFCSQPAREAPLLLDTFAGFSPAGKSVDKGPDQGTNALVFSGNSKAVAQAVSQVSRFPAGSQFLLPLTPELEKEYKDLIDGLSRGAATKGPSLFSELVQRVQLWWIAKRLQWVS